MSTCERPTATIVVASRSHRNTSRVAEAIAHGLAGRFTTEVVESHRIDGASLVGRDLLGFGSGIYYWSMDRELCELIGQLAPGTAAASFLFATSGFAPRGPQRFFLDPARTLSRKGIEVLGRFDTRGWDTSGPLGLVGGVRKGRPDEADLLAATDFGACLVERFATRRAIDHDQA